MPNEVCPYCGADSKSETLWKCGSNKLTISKSYRNDRCYENQIAALQQGIRETVEVVWEIVNPGQASGDSCNLIPMKSVSKATALLPVLEGLVEDKWTAEDIDAAKKEADKILKELVGEG